MGVNNVRNEEMGCSDGEYLLSRRFHEQLYSCLKGMEGLYSPDELLHMATNMPRGDQTHS